VPLKVPYTLTDGYLKFDAFMLGLKLSDFYLWSDDCINNLVLTVDDKDYFSNNRTLGRQYDNQTLLHPVLNFTGLIGGHLSEATPNCYKFYTSVREQEEERFNSYNGWGDIMIAFLFN
jgi:hypothetical protein